MTKISEKEIVKIVEGEIEKFVKEWIKTPYVWESETDVHAELYMRIKLSLHKKGLKPRQCTYTNGENSMVDAEYIGRVYCKPKTYIKKANYPDIVIYKGAKNKYKNKDKENEPMLWVCKIKYFTDWSSALYKECVENDIGKLKRLLNLKEKGAEYAAYLILQRTKKSKSGLNRTLCRDLHLKKNNKILEILKKAEDENTKLKIFCYSTGYK